MDIQNLIDLEEEIRRIIELSLDNRTVEERDFKKETEFYGQENEPMVDNNPFLGNNGFEKPNTLAGYLEKMSSEELKTVLSLMYMGEEIAEEDVEDDNLEEAAEVFNRYYESVPEDRHTIIEYILEETANLEKYLTNGLLYCM